MHLRRSRSSLSFVFGDLGIWSLTGRESAVWALLYSSKAYYKAVDGRSSMCASSIVFSTAGEPSPTAFTMRHDLCVDHLVPQKLAPQQQRKAINQRFLCLRCLKPLQVKSFGLTVITIRLMRQPQYDRVPLSWSENVCGDPCKQYWPDSNTNILMFVSWICICCCGLTQQRHLVCSVQCVYKLLSIYDSTRMASQAKSSHRCTDNLKLMPPWRERLTAYLPMRFSDISPWFAFIMMVLAIAAAIMLTLGIHKLSLLLQSFLGGWKHICPTTPAVRYHSQPTVSWVFDCLPIWMALSRQKAIRRTTFSMRTSMHHGLPSSAALKVLGKVILFRAYWRTPFFMMVTLDRINILWQASYFTSTSTPAKQQLRSARQRILRPKASKSRSSCLHQTSGLWRSSIIYPASLTTSNQRSDHYSFGTIRSTLATWGLWWTWTLRTARFHSTWRLSIRSWDKWQYRKKEKLASTTTSSRKSWRRRN